LELNEVEVQRQMAELKMEALQSVMNPHFIFNTLNSIQYFVARHDRANAIGCISTFSKLIRSILGSCSTGRIPLKDELELLNNYAQLELVRFENAFTFSIKIEEDLDVANIEIPSLLIQPYLEKSISHLLAQHDIKGQIELAVIQQEDMLIFKITDNNVTPLKQLDPTLFQLRPDKGMISEARLLLIAQKTNATAEIEDIFSEDKLKIGLCTTIKLPLAANLKPRQQS
jgi:LytS/YehU family sensor histidine kinase